MNITIYVQLLLGEGVPHSIGSNTQGSSPIQDVWQYASHALWTIQHGLEDRRDQGEECTAAHKALEEVVEAISQTQVH